MNARLFRVTARCTAGLTGGSWVSGDRCVNGRVVEASLGGKCFLFLPRNFSRNLLLYNMIRSRMPHVWGGALSLFGHLGGKALRSS